MIEGTGLHKFRDNAWDIKKKTIQSSKKCLKTTNG